jgi:predicted nucleotidyltransferase
MRSPPASILTGMAVSLRDQAEQVTTAMVGAFPEVSGVCLFGSVARGDDDDRSDIDLFVIGSDPDLTPSQIRRRLRLQNRPPKVSIVYHTPKTLERYMATGSRFLVHLQLEGEVLYDQAGLLRSIQDQPPLSTPIDAEIEGQLGRLQLFDRPQRFNGNFLFPLSHVFAAGKAIVMAILATNEIYEFNRDAAFDAFVARFPDSQDDVETLRRLAPFAALVSKGTEEELPFSYHDCEAELAEAIEAVRQLARYADG